MKAKNKKLIDNIMIIVLPILLITLIMMSDLISNKAMSEFDTAISIGAIMTLLILMLKDRNKGRK